MALLLKFTYAAYMQRPSRLVAHCAAGHTGSLIINKSNHLAFFSVRVCVKFLGEASTRRASTVTFCRTPSFYPREIQHSANLAVAVTGLSAGLSAGQQG